MIAVRSVADGNDVVEILAKVFIEGLGSLPGDVDVENSKPARFFPAIRSEFTGASKIHRRPKVAKRNNSRFLELCVTRSSAACGFFKWLERVWPAFTRSVRRRDPVAVAEPA